MLGLSKRRYYVLSTVEVVKLRAKIYQEAAPAGTRAKNGASALVPPLDAPAEMLRFSFL
jgi:hypothetical protein